MNTESERLVTAQIDHAQTMQDRCEAQQEQVESVFAALPQRVEAATRESVAAVVRAERQRLHAKATLFEGGCVFGDAAMGDSSTPSPCSGWRLSRSSPVGCRSTRRSDELKQRRADEAALWSDIQQGQKKELISKCGTGKPSRLCVRINRSAQRYGEDSSYVVVWGH